MKMPAEKIDTAMFAPCGMNCLVCYKHCYHKKPCAGCLNGDMGKPEHCRKCKIKDCIKGKGLSYCFECPDYPCKLIKNLEKSYNKRYQASLMVNSEFVRQHGLERFMEQLAEQSTSPSLRWAAMKRMTSRTSATMPLSSWRSFTACPPIIC